MISKETYEIVMANADVFDSAIIYERDFQYNLYVMSYFRLHTHTKSQQFRVQDS
jgi:hypothetical protein